MHSDAAGVDVGVELSLPESMGENDINSALLAAMRSWELETKDAREAEEERASRLRQLMN